jgi:toxin FitB
MYLLDTNVLFYARKPENPAAAWLRTAASPSLYVSVISLGEIERGVAMKERSDRKAAESLAEWLGAIRTIYSDRALPITDRIAVMWGRLAAQRTRGDADGLIAATALVHGLVLVTGNTRDFDDTGVRLLDPWNL